ncbi:MAG: rod shape-determining protein RodA, partial [Candidatus Kapabacteria bacterium]|nr:rod shape-determining protein RodA [Candidatus Kapabacteria bacterium]
SEFAKVATLLMIGRFVEGKGVNVQNIRDLRYVVGIVILPVLLILGEPDTGTATVFMAMLLGVLLWAGADLFMLFVIGVLPVVGITAIYGVMYETTIPIIICITVLALVVLYFRRGVVLSAVVVAAFIAIGVGISPVYNKLPDHQKSRIKTFFEPEKYPKDEGYHVIQSMMAVGSGGLTGKGFLHGTQTQLRYIPEQWTDFIFCVPGEEFGFIGSVTVLGLLAFLILRILRIARFCRDEFSTVVAFGFASILLYHTFVNIGMAIGVFPVMGIPLPFMSSGGTALIVNMCTMGILLNFYRVKQKSLLMT